MFTDVSDFERHMLAPERNNSRVGVHILLTCVRMKCKWAVLDIRKGLRFIDSTSGCKIATKSMQVLQISKISYLLTTKANVTKIYANSEDGKHCQRKLS